MARGLDTDLIIDFLRGKGPGVAVIGSLLRDRRLRGTAITGFELRLGTDFLDRHGDIMRLMHIVGYGGSGSQCDRTFQ